MKKKMVIKENGKVVFSFLHRHDEAFSTEPLQHSNGKPIMFNHTQVWSLSLSYS